MRKFLLASVATLGDRGIDGCGFGANTARGAGAAAVDVGTSPDIRANRRTEPGAAGIAGGPAPVAYVNDNNNYQAPMLPGALANPTPGTIVVHINGKVQVDVGGVGAARIDARTAPNGAPGVRPITSIGSGPLAAGSPRPPARHRAPSWA